MKTTSLLFMVVILTSAFTLAYSQSGEWTWVSGDSLSEPSTMAVYGVKGIASSANVPGARENSASWTDNGGNLWMFGGMGYADSGATGFLNDLWEFDPVTSNWTWVSGSNTPDTNGVYGTKGVASAANVPGARLYAVSWTDSSGYLWLMGGQGYAASGSSYDFLNDVWKFNTGTKQWTWVNGDSSLDGATIYGAKGIPAAANRPGGRLGGMSFTDRWGTLWYFGGYGYGGVNQVGAMNDLWSYDIASNRWTWVSGDTTVGKLGIYGTKGTVAPGNKPGSRFYATTWVDFSGNLWMFGGYGQGATNLNGPNEALNDLWMFDRASKQWTYESGDTVQKQAGVYGTKGLESANNKPGARYQLVSWTDRQGNLWLHGGYGCATSATITNVLNDLWKFDLADGLWSWMSGDSIINATGVYGTRGVAAPTNKPGGRYTHVSFTNNTDTLWLFSANGIDAAGRGAQLNDLWHYNAEPSAAAPTVLFTVSDTAVCPGGTVTFTDQSTGSPTAWQWTFTGGIPGTSSSPNPTVTYNQPGTYPVKLVVSNATGADSLTKNAYITVNPLPVAGGIIGPAVVCAGSNAQLSDTGSSGSLQWQYSADGISFSTIAGDTTSTNSITALPDSAYYRVMATNGCGTDSSAVYQLPVDSVPVPVVTATDTVMCSGDSTQVCTSTAYTSYLWNTSDTTHCTSATSAGGYWLTVTDTNHCSAVSNHAQVSVYPVPSVSITVQGDTLSSFGQANYRWIKDGVPIDSSTGAVYVAHQSGDYAVQVTDTNGCTTTSEAVTVTGVQDITRGEGVSVYPNPNSADSWQLVVSNKLVGAKLEVYDEQGRQVLKSEILNSKSKITANELPAGVYCLRITSGSLSVVKKLIKL